ncbi:tetratricopeptide repeat protein [Mesobacillus subterraneus]|uniref:Tetratricopeptide repeat protein n=1 Tax=Mesobacillus subterraneus TaxID=285983 RepID=A0A3R9FB94_9BACI|nr:tetratricopeptide repeat protein [Mesobacillus subterraneus]RSD23342.1 tetratricopeptide repeat protein [Mesobacillus subterraneus]
MKKRDSEKNNVILFPGLEKRLLEKGLDYLKEKKYRDAIHYLEQALRHDPENSDIFVGLVLANYEAGNIKQAKEIASEMLRSGLGDYIQVIDLYLMILVQLNEYNEIVSTIEALLEEREIPAEKHEHFIRMLEFGKRMQEGKVEPEMLEPFEEEPGMEDQVLDLFSYTDPNDQVMVAAKLARENIRPYKMEITEYIASSEGHPFLKTMLLNILKEQEFGDEIAVEKFGWEEAFVPASLPELKEYIENSGILQLLSGEIENEDPVLYENVQSLVERYFFLVYPFRLPAGRAEAWAAACHFIANEYYGFDDSLDSFAEVYGSSKEEAEQVLGFIRRLEEISYPII